jgi:hypothetical protein
MAIFVKTLSNQQLTAHFLRREVRCGGSIKDFASQDSAIFMI